MEIFRAVMLTGTTSGAARMLFMSQPVVSRTIAHIETTLGVLLFDRKHGALRPTDDAQVIFREVEEIYESAMRVDGLVSNLKLGKRRRISFCSSPALGLSVVPQAIKKYSDKYAHVAFSYKTLMVKDMPMELLGKRAEFALSIWPIEHPNLSCELLFDSKIVLIVPKGHALAVLDLVRLDQLKEYPLILYGREMPMGAMIRNALVDAGVNSEPIVEMNRSELACSLVHAGVGVALVNRSCVDEEIWSGLCVKEIDVKISASVCLITSRFEVIPSDCKEFLQVLRGD